MTSRATLPLYLVSSATSLFGNASISIVLPWLVLLRTGDAAVAGLVAAASAMPSALAALIGGHLADRLGRRTITVLADVGSAVSVAALAVVDLTIGLSVPWFIALGVLGALFDVPGMTAREAMVADVARTSGVSLDRVAALRGALFGVSFLAGPALAGGLLALIPATNVVWVTAASSALAAGTMLAMPLARSAEGDQGDDASPFAGFGLVRRTPVLWSMLVISLASAVLVAPLLAVVLPAHFQGLGRPELLGFSVSAYAVGTIVGSVLYGALFGDRRRPAWVASMGLMMVGFAAVATLDRVLAGRGGDGAGRRGRWPAATHHHGRAHPCGARGGARPRVRRVLGGRHAGGARGAGGGVRDHRRLGAGRGRPGDRRAVVARGIVGGGDALAARLPSNPDRGGRRC